MTGRTAIPLGTVLGLLLSTGGIFAIKALLYGQNTVQYLHVHVAWQMLIAGILLSTVTLVLSARRPAKQAAKSSQRKAAGQKSGRSRLQSQDVRRFLFWYPILWEYRRFR